MLSSIRFSALLLCLIFCMSSCKKEDPLPAATQNGANTFGCKINGKAWIPDGGGGFSGIKPVTGGYQGTYISDPAKCNVYVRSRKSDKTVVHLFIREVCVKGVYDLNSNTGTWDVQQRPLSYGLYIDSDGNYYITDVNHTGKVIVTHADTTNGVVSGRFEFTAINYVLNKVVTVTDGRFDIDFAKQ